MIVMKFGGSSLASRSSIKRAAALVSAQIHRTPVVVVSAIGDTTDRLLDVLACASRANSHLVWKTQEQLRSYHFCLAEDLVSAGQIESIDSYLRQIFRELHIRMLEVCEGERRVTPELQDWVVSLGEQVSSRIVASAFQSQGIETLHMDARNLIVTDEQFNKAEPLQWETYAKIRWAVPMAAKDRVVVLGGFIGATGDGRTTTLGRGGSDLTASLIGAALNAEEIQVWKDVDGLLTWDPRIKRGGYRVKNLSYSEMAELARAGATILHPESVAPAQRLRIPITIRNTFHPECEGTKIGALRSGAVVKSIACKTDLTVLELRSPANEVSLDKFWPQLEEFYRKEKTAATLLGMSAEVIYLAIDGNTKAIKPGFPVDGCIEAHIRRRQAIITLVGAGITESSVFRELPGILAGAGALILPAIAGSCGVRIAVPAEALLSSLELLHRVFFSDCSPGHFAVVEPLEEKEPERVGTTCAGPVVSRPEPRFSGKNSNLSIPGAPAPA